MICVRKGQVRDVTRGVQCGTSHHLRGASAGPALRLLLQRNVYKNGEARGHPLTSSTQQRGANAPAGGLFWHLQPREDSVQHPTSRRRSRETMGEMEEWWLIWHT